MDLARACYFSTMRFAADGSRDAQVQWYFCDPGADVFPVPHAFFSTNWDDPRRQAIGLGEQWDSSFQFANGQAPFSAPGTGSFCGDVTWYQDGAPADAPAIEYSVDGVPTCCPQPLCQPWSSVHLGTRVVKRVSTGVTWPQSSSGLGVYTAHNPADLTETFTFRREFLPCLGFDRTEQPAKLVARVAGIGHELFPVLVAYNPGNFTGTWAVPVNPFKYSGELFTFKHTT